MRACGDRERLCADAQCSHAGRCSLAASLLSDDEAPPAAALARNAAPQIALRGAAEVVVEMGVSYTKCTADTPVGAPCDPGCSARDPEDGELSARVLACSPDGVRNQWTRRGVRGCNVSTAVPGTYAIRYEVRDSNGAAAHVIRQLRVLPACGCV